MEYRISKEKLIDILIIWDGFIKRTIRLIACGGTALTLLGIKPSTKDVDFLVSDLNECENLIKLMKSLGYNKVTGSGWARDDGFIFDIFCGKKVHTTELLTFPLIRGGNIPFEIGTKHICLGILNFYDIIISKMFRGATADVEDCISLVENRKINLRKLVSRYKETADYDINPRRMMINLIVFLRAMEKRGFRVKNYLKKLEE